MRKNWPTVKAAALAFPFLLIGYLHAMAAESRTALPMIEVEATENGVAVIGRVVALTDGNYTSRMTIERTGTSGKTATTQGADSLLDAGQTANVARVGLSMAPGDALVVEMVVSADGQRIASTSLTVGGPR